MFTTIIVQPLFNLLVLIYALLPGHNFGLSLIIFTVIIRILLWPILRKSLRQTKAMRKLQPDIKRIKQATKGNRTKEQQMIMELYKEKGINPFGTFPILILQFIVLIGLYSGLRRLIADPHTIVNFAYPTLQHLSWMKELSHNIHLFDNTLFGVVDLGRSAAGHAGGIYFPAFLIVVGSAVATYFQSKQVLPNDKDQRSLRSILKDAGDGKQADQTEVNAAVGRSTIYFIPVMIFIFTLGQASALALYWLVGGIVAVIQQASILNDDEEEMEAMSDKPARNIKAIPEAEVVEIPTAKTPKPTPKPKKANKKRKKR